MFLAAVLAMSAAACGGSSSAGDDAPAVDGGGIDAPEGPGCGALSPRTVTPETFVGPTGLQARLISLVDSAQDTLDVHMYLFTVDQIAARIVAAKQRGVAVRLILDPDNPGNDQVRPALMSGGVPMRNATPLYSFSHAKYMLIDGDRAVIMSNNFNYDAMNKERNYGMIDRDPDDVADVQAIFDMDWMAAGGMTPTAADLACTRLIVSPNNAKQRILDHINRATTTLELELQYLSETSVRDAVAAAKMRGVAVRVILSERTDEAIPALTALGIPVRFPPTTLLIHAKLIIADGVVFVGSENMSLTSLTKNRELGALVAEPTPAGVIKTQFESDWTGANP